MSSCLRPRAWKPPVYSSWPWVISLSPRRPLPVRVRTVLPVTWERLVIGPWLAQAARWAQPAAALLPLVEAVLLHQLMAWAQRSRS